MEKPVLTSPLLPDAEAPTLRRSPSEATPRSDELSTTLHPSQRTPSPTGVALQSASWNLPFVQRERYLLDGVVAEGGHGRILRAQDLHLERPVALKEPTAFGGSTEDRFLREARITARLQHPAIVPVYEAGRWPNGEPFYAMKLVSGRSLAHLIDAMSSLGTRLAALPHVLAVAEAIAYAHSQKVIHRDLKPSNILVGEFGETVVVDWGLAKEMDRPESPLTPALTPPASPEPEHTQLGTVLGTPAYMPPEQAAGQPVDERADVYSLGAILYHLLSGSPPYLGASSQEVIQRVLSEQPTPLSRLQPGLPQELLTIVSRAMAREPAERHPSARELAEDLRRFQTGQLVGSHRYTAWQRVRRFARQYRAPLIVAAVALLALATKGVRDHRLIVEALAEARMAQARAEQRQLAAEQSQREATQRADDLTVAQARGELARSPGAALRRLAALSTFYTEWGRVRTLAADATARGLPILLRDDNGHGHALNHIEFSSDGTRLLSSADDRKVLLWDLRTQTSQVLETFGDEAWRSTFSPDERYVASTGKEGLVKLRDQATGTSRELRGHTGPVPCMDFSRDGRFLLTSGYDGQLRQWNVASGTFRLLGTHQGGVSQFEMLPDGRHVLSAGTKDRSLRLWDLETGQSRLLLSHPHHITGLAVSSQGAFAVSTEQGELLVWDSPQGRPRTVRTHSGSLSAVVFSRDGRYVATQSHLGAIYLWDSESASLRTLPSIPGWRFALAFSPDGRWLAAGGKDGKARLWEVATGNLRLLHGAEFTISAVTFSPDGKWLASASHDGSIHLHEVEARYPLTVTRHEKPLPLNAISLDWRHLTVTELKSTLQSVVSAVAFTPDGRHVLSAGRRDGMVRLSTLEGTPLVAVQAHPGDEMAAAFVLPDGRRLVTAGRQGRVSLWDEQGRRLQEWKGPEHPIEVLSLSADGTRVAAGAGSEVWLWEAETGRGRSLGRHPHSVRALAFSPNGRLLASGGTEGELRLWDLAGGTDRRLHRHQDEVVAIAFSPDGAYLASGSRDHTVWLQPLDSETGHRVDMSGVGILSLQFSPDGKVLFSTSLGSMVVMRTEVSTREELSMLRGHESPVLHIAFSPDGQRLVSASADHKLRVWDLESGEGRGLPGHETPVVWAAFSPDGRQVLSAGQDGTVRLWPDDLPLEPKELHEWVRKMASR